MPSSRGSSRPRGLTCISRISCIGRWILCYLRRPWLKHMAKSCGEKGWERSMACFYFFVYIWLGANSFNPLFPHVCSLSHLPLSFLRPVCPRSWGTREQKEAQPPAGRVKWAFRLCVVSGECHSMHCSFYLSDGDIWPYHVCIYIFSLTWLLLLCLTHFCLCLKTAHSG